MSSPQGRPPFAPLRLDAGDLLVLQRSGLFAQDWFLKRNADLDAAGLDPLTHYLEYGQAEGRAIFDAVGLTGNIKGGFDAEFYLLANADVARVATLDGGPRPRRVVANDGEGGHGTNRGATH